MDEGIDLSDLFDIPGGGELHPFPVKSRRRIKPSRKCSYCRQEGHDRRTCPSRPKCGICRKVGHDRRTCPDRIQRPIRASYLKNSKRQNSVAVNPRPRCKCGYTGSQSCITTSCKNCCRSPYCKYHGKKNQRIESRQNPINREKHSLFGNILSFLPDFFGGFLLLSVMGLIFGGAYFTFNALMPVFEGIWDFFEYIWDGIVTIYYFLVAVANFIGSIFEFIIDILEFIYEVIELLVWVVIGITSLIVWLIVSILSYAGELLAWIF